MEVWPQRISVIYVKGKQKVRSGWLELDVLSQMLERQEELAKNSQLQNFEYLIDEFSRT